MRILTVSSLYPNTVQPQRGLFVRERLRRLQQQHSVAAAVVAPVPWFPSGAKTFGAYGLMSRIPRVENAIEGNVYHPRFVHIPRLSDGFSPLAFAGAIRRAIRRYDLKFDLIDAHFLFPDGVAAVLVARSLGRPVALTARGSDVNLIANEVVAGRWIRWAARRADALLAVSNDLARRLSEIAGRHVQLIENGVDREQFCPSTDRAALRRRLELDRFTVLSVGNLIDLKGHDLVIDAVANIPDAELFVVGEGPLRDQLRAHVTAARLEKRVRLLGSLTQEKLADYYRGADVLVLASSHEGMPNVLLESLACGTPVVATRTAGAVEALHGSCAGVLCERTASGVAGAINRLRELAPDRATVRQSVDRFDWRVCASLLYKQFHALIEGDKR